MPDLLLLLLHSVGLAQKGEPGKECVDSGNNHVKEDEIKESTGIPLKKDA